jgi:hypothetical protein
LRMGLLEITGADLGRRYLRGDGEHRHSRAVTVEQAVDQVQIAGPAAAGADGELTGQMRFRASREGRDLLVPNVDPVDLALSPERVGEAVEAIADNAIDPLDASRSQGLHELISYRSCHGSRLLSTPAAALESLGAGELTFVVGSLLSMTWTRPSGIALIWSQQRRHLISSPTPPLLERQGMGVRIFCSASGSVEVPDVILISGAYRNSSQPSEGENKSTPWELLEKTRCSAKRALGPCNHRIHDDSSHDIRRKCDQPDISRDRCVSEAQRVQGLQPVAPRKIGATEQADRPARQQRGRREPACEQPEDPSFALATLRCAA